jgi:F0F1-type ATP synthase assembly protein I
MISVILLNFWMIAMLTNAVTGGLIHLLPVAAVVVVIVRISQGWRTALNGKMEPPIPNGRYLG